MATKDDRNLMDEIFGNDSADEIFGSEDQAVKKEETTDTQAPDREEPEKKEETKEGQETGEEKTDQEPEQKAPSGRTEAWKEMTAGRFESPEDLAKAYRDIEIFSTQSRQEVSSLRRELEELRHQVMPEMTKKQQTEWKEHAQAAINAAVIDENPEQLIQLIAQTADSIAEQKLQQKYQHLAPVAEQYRYQQEVDAWLNENPDAVDHIGDMVQLVSANPGLVTRPAWLDYVYARVLNQKMKMTKKVTKETTAKTQAEKLAAGMPDAVSRQKKEKKSPEEELLDSLFAPSKSGGIFG